MKDKLVFWTVALGFALVCYTDAKASDLYMTAGFGQSRMPEEQAANLWHQPGFAHIAEERSNAWKLGVGMKLNRYIAMELDYRDLGQFNQQALYVSDQGREGNYNPITKQCNGECEPTSVSYEHGYTKGIGLSFVASPDWTVAPYIRGGLFYHYSNFYTSQKFGTEPYRKDLVRFTSNAEGPANEAFKNTGIGPMYGIGVRAGFLELEYTKYPNVGANDGPYRNVETVMLNVKVGF